MLGQIIAYAKAEFNCHDGPWKEDHKEKMEGHGEGILEESAYMQVDMQAKFMAMRCPDKRNLREFLEGLRVKKKKELVQAGVEVGEKNYFSIIISSFLYILSNFTLSQLVVAQYLSLKITCCQCSWRNLIVNECNSSINEFSERAKKIATRPYWPTSLQS